MNLLYEFVQCILPLLLHFSVRCNKVNVMPHAVANPRVLDVAPASSTPNCFSCCCICIGICSSCRRRHQLHLLHGRIKCDSPKRSHSYRLWDLDISYIHFWRLEHTQNQMERTGKSPNISSTEVAFTLDSVCASACQPAVSLPLCRQSLSLFKMTTTISRATLLCLTRSPGLSPFSQSRMRVARPTIWLDVDVSLLISMPCHFLFVFLLTFSFQFFSLYLSKMFSTCDKCWTCTIVSQLPAFSKSCHGTWG